MIIIGFNEQGYEYYGYAFEADAVNNSEEVINKVLEEGVAVYCGDGGEMFVFDANHLGEVYK